jgi:hypothetical protein
MKLLGLSSVLISQQQEQLATFERTDELISLLQSVNPAIWCTFKIRRYIPVAYNFGYSIIEKW